MNPSQEAISTGTLVFWFCTAVVLFAIAVKAFLNQNGKDK